MRRFVFSILSTLGVFAFLLTSSTCARAQEADAQPIPSASPSLIQANAEKTPPVALRFAPIAGSNATDLGQAPGTRAMAFHLVLKHSEAQQVALEKYAIEIANPRSPHYNKPLTVAEFTQRFGANAEDIAALKNWLQSQGFVVDSIHPGQMYIAFHGTAGAAEEAFGTEIHDYLMPDGRQLYANTRAIKIPAGFELAVLRVDGLDNFGVLQMPNYDGPVAIESHDSNIIKSNLPTEQERNPNWNWTPSRPILADATANVRPDNKTSAVTLAAGAAVALGSGLPVTLTATLTYVGAATPTGAMDLYDADGALSVQTSLSNCTAGVGTFTCTYSWASASAPTGTDKLYAQYTGDANFQSVASAAVSYVNTKASGTAAPTSTSLTISPGSVTAGASTLQTVTWTATWATAPASGTVSIYGYDGPLGVMATTPINSCSLSGTTYTCTFSYTPPSTLPAGSYPVIATFTGDSTDAGFYDCASSLLNVTATGTAVASMSVTGQNYFIPNGSINTAVNDIYFFPAISYTGSTPPTGSIVLSDPGVATSTGGFLAEAELPASGQTFSSGENGFFFAGSTGAETIPSGQTYSCVTNTTAKTIGCTMEIANEYEPFEGPLDNVNVTLSVAYSGDSNYAPESTTFTQTTSFWYSATTVTISPASETYPTATVPTATITAINEGSSENGTSSAILPTGASVIVGISGAAYYNAWQTIALNSTNCTATTGTHAHYTCAVPLTIFPPTSLAGAYTVTAYFTGGNLGVIAGGVGQQYLGASYGTATYTYSLQTTTVAMVSPTSGSPVSQVYGSPASFAVTGTLTWAGGGSAAPTAADMMFSSTAAGTFSTTTCGTTSPATCTSTFTPSATNAVGSYNISVTYVGDNKYAASTTSTITGDYVVTAATPTLALTPSPLAAPQGSTTGVTLTATGTAAGNGGSPTGTVTFGGSYASYGSLSATTCTLVSGTCSVTFTPNGTTAVGTYSGVFTASVAANGNYLVSNTAMDSLQITAPPNVITFTSVGHNFGQIAVGSSTSGSSNYGVKLTNTATSAFAFGGIALNGSSEFSVQTNCPATIAAGGSCEILFIFAPTTTGTVSATWSVSSTSTGFSYSPSNGGTLSGSGVANGGVSVTSAGHNFGTVTVGQTSSAYGTELSNSSSSTETISLGPVPAGAPFTMLTNCGTKLVPGQSCEIEFTFSPTSTSPVSVVVPLSGTPTAISSGGVVLANGGLALSGN